MAPIIYKQAIFSTLLLIVWLTLFITLLGGLSASQSSHSISSLFIRDLSGVAMDPGIIIACVIGGLMIVAILVACIVGVAGHH